MAIFILCIWLEIMALTSEPANLIHPCPAPAHTDPVISDCPEYAKLAPRTTVRTRRLAMKSHSLGPTKGGQAKREEEEEAIDELRMCTPCTKLIHRCEN